MRFCMITTFYPPYNFGGDGISIERLVHMLARQGHEVDVIHCVDSFNTLTNRRLPPVLSQSKPGVTVHSLASGVGMLSPLATYLTGYPFFKGKKIRSILASKRFDVIHFHNISLIGGPKILKYGEAIKLYTMREHWLICPTNVLFKFKREACNKKACFRCQLAYRRPPQLWRYTPMLDQALKHVDAFIAQSEFTLKRHIADRPGMPIVRIPNFVTEPAEEPYVSMGNHLPLPNRPFFLFVGRLEKLKGLQTIIPLFKHYRKADLVIAGDGDYARELKKLAGNSPGIHFLGNVLRADLHGIYAQAIAVLVPSITFEVFPNIIMEAHAAKTPVIVRDLGSLPEAVAESGGGLVFHNHEDLLDAMELLFNNPELRKSLGEAGYRTYRSQWTEEAYLERYLKLIEDVRLRKQGIQELTPNLVEV